MTELTGHPPEGNTQTGVTVALQVNGRPVELLVKPLTSLLDRLARAPATDGDKEGLRPGRLWRLHCSDRWPASALVPHAPRAMRRQACDDH